MATKILAQKPCKKPVTTNQPIITIIFSDSSQDTCVLLASRVSLITPLINEVLLISLHQQQFQTLVNLPLTPPLVWGGSGGTYAKRQLLPIFISQTRLFSVSQYNVPLHIPLHQLHLQLVHLPLLPVQSRHFRVLQFEDLWISAIPAFRRFHIRSIYVSLANSAIVHRGTIEKGLIERSHQIVRQ